MPNIQDLFAVYEPGETIQPHEIVDLSNRYGLPAREVRALAKQRGLKLGRKAGPRDIAQLTATELKELDKRIEQATRPVTYNAAAAIAEGMNVRHSELEARLQQRRIEFVDLLGRPNGVDRIRTREPSSAKVDMQYGKLQGAANLLNMALTSAFVLFLVFLAFAFFGILKGDG